MSRNNDKELENKVKALYVTNVIELQPQFEEEEISRITQEIRNILEKADRAHFMQGLSWVLAEAAFTDKALEGLIEETRDNWEFISEFE